MTASHTFPCRVDRRCVLQGLGFGAGALLVPDAGLAKATLDKAPLDFAAWVDQFIPRVQARGIALDLYRRVMHALVPDPDVYQLDRAQPEFTETIWQYLNRRVSDWRIRAGREKLEQHQALLARVESTYGVDPAVMTALWGMESSYGELVDNPKYMRPVLAALATLAWGEPRRRSYWEQEFLNALVIIARGWSTPNEMRGSWAGAMGHTQWMPEVWLNMGVDFNGDGRISPFGAPDDALAGTARFLATRGKYQRGAHWGFEVKTRPNFPMVRADNRTKRTLEEWTQAGLAFAQDNVKADPRAPARAYFPAGPQGPGFLLLQNFYAVKSYNPSFNYALAICHLSDRLKGAGPFITSWPGAEPPLSLNEIQDMQQRLTARGYDTEGTDGRVGSKTQEAIVRFQRDQALIPADGYAGQRVLKALREMR